MKTSIFKSKKFWKFSSLALYLLASIVLIVEASLPSTVSAEHSNSVGNALADFINSVGGEQSKIIEPTSLKITNGDKTFYVGDSINIQTQTLPEDTSYAACTFTTSDENIATISQEGLVNFISSGEVTITATNDYNNELKDSITFTVLDIYPTSITSTINSFTSTSEQEKRDGIYVLYTNSSYAINTTFTPENTSLKNLTYTVINENYSNYFSLTDNRIVTRTLLCETPFEIEIKTLNNISTTVSFIIQNGITNIVPLERIEVNFVDESDKTIHLGIRDTENITSSLDYTISFYPSNATYKEYYLESADSNIASINDFVIRGVSPGETEVYLRSSYYKDIYTPIRVIVEDVKLQSFSFYVNDTNKLFVGNSYYVHLQSVIPLNSTVYQTTDPTNYRFTSSNENIATFDEDNLFYINTVGAGTCNLIIEIINSPYNDKSIDSNWIRCTIPITVYDPKPVCDFDINIDFFYNEPTVYGQSSIAFTHREIDLTKAITLRNLYDNDGNIVSPSSYNTELRYFSYSGKENTSKTIYEETPTAYSRYTVRLYPFKDDPEFYLTKLIGFNVVVPIKGVEINDTLYEAKAERITIDSINYIHLGEVDIDIYEKLNISLIYDYKEPLYFQTKSLNTSVATVNIPSTADDLTVIGNKGGSAYLNIIPYTPEHRTLSPVSFILTINVKQVKATTMSLVIKKGESIVTFETFYRDGFEIYRIGGNRNDQYEHLTQLVVGDVLTFEVNYDVEPSYTNVHMNTTTPDLVDLNMPYITLLKAGGSYVRVVDNANSLLCRLDIACTNIIKLDEENPISVVKNGTHDGDLSFSESNKTYTISKGCSYKIIPNLTSDSTYKNATFTSSNPEVATVGGDGTVTAIDGGKTKITLQVKDGYSKTASYVFYLNVEGVEVIKSITDFLFFVRKGVGHFGAFFVLGIFSSMFYYLAFDNHRKFFPLVILLNLFAGFGLAMLTEIIQIFVPGRAGLMSDVLLDFSGFGVGTAIVSLLFIIYYIVKHFKNKQSNNY